MVWGFAQRSRSCVALHSLIVPCSCVFVHIYTHTHIHQSVRRAPQQSDVGGGGKCNAFMCGVWCAACDLPRVCVFRKHRASKNQPPLVWSVRVMWVVHMWSGMSSLLSSIALYRARVGCCCRCRCRRCCCRRCCCCCCSSQMCACGSCCGGVHCTRNNKGSARYPTLPDVYAYYRHAFIGILVLYIFNYFI